MLDSRTLDILGYNQSHVVCQAINSDDSQVVNPGCTWQGFPYPKRAPAGILSKRKRFLLQATSFVLLGRCLRVSAGAIL
jgi:hypothetical protein